MLFNLAIQGAVAECPCHVESTCDGWCALAIVLIFVYVFIGLGMAIYDAVVAWDRANDQRFGANDLLVARRHFARLALTIPLRAMWLPLLLLWRLIKEAF